MDYKVEMNRIDCEKEKEAREKQLAAYAEVIQRRTLEKSAGIIGQLVEGTRCLTLLKKYKQSKDFIKY